MPNAADYIIQGFGGLDQGLSKYREENRQISPVEKWAAMAAAGQIDPTTAAHNAKLEAAGYNIPAQQSMSAGPQGPQQAQPEAQRPQGMQSAPTVGPMSQQQAGYQQQAKSLGESQAAAQQAYPGSFNSAPQVPDTQQSRGLGMPEPKTPGDMHALFAAAPFLKPRGKTPEEMYFEYLKEQGRNTRSDNSLGVRKTEGAANRTSAETIAGAKDETDKIKIKQQWDMQQKDIEAQWSRLQSTLRASEKRLSMAKSADERIQILKDMESEVGSAENSLATASGTNAYALGDDMVKNFVSDRSQEITDTKKHIADLRHQVLTGPRNQATQSNGTQNSTTLRRPQGLGPTAADLNSALGK